MDTPKREVSWLENFPTDIWAYFVRYIAGEHLGRLMMTGATQLRRRLKSPNAVKSIELGTEFIVEKSIPRCLNEFPSLKELSIHIHYHQWSKSGLTIASIPCGVRALRLEGLFQHQEADALFGENGTSFMLNDCLPHIEVLDLYSLDFESYAWMSHSPQSLTKLRLISWKGDVELPSSLIHFDVFSVHLSASSIVSKLPPLLESFIADSMSGVDLLLPLLPRSTYKLSLGTSVKYSDVPRSPKTFLEQLPKSLTCLRFTHVSGIDFQREPTLATLLPSTLTELDIGLWVNFPCSVWPLLPQQLTKLSLSTEDLFVVASNTADEHGVAGKVEFVPFGYLPKSLTSLKLRSSRCHFSGHPPTSDRRACFPPQLTSLSIPNMQLSPKMARLLPSSLTYLIVRNLCEQSCQHLPNGLKTLAPFPTLMSPNLIKFLPKSLTSFDTFVELNVEWYDPNTGETIERVSDLPEYSVHESCLSSRFDWKDHSPLPPTLTKFSLGSAEELGDSFLLHQRLPNLLELELGNSKNFTDLCIPLLPRYLTVLNFWCSSSISGKSFPFLPRGLIHLDLNRSESIFDSDIQHLPRTLKRLYLNCAIHLTELSVPDFPRNLEVLYLMRNEQFIKEDFQKFTSLKILNIGYY